MPEPRIRLALIATGVLAFVLLLTLEIVTEEEEASLADFLVDAVVLLLTVTAAASGAALFARIERLGAERAALVVELEHARRDGAAFRAQTRAHAAGVRAAMDAQFRVWRMTPAECEVALLILKGLSHKEIAILRKTSETTVRQQAQAVYRKSGLAGKGALSAYFLEDLLSPEARGADLGKLEEEAGRILHS